MTTGRLRSLWALSRGGNWWHSKIPPLLAVGYAVALLHGLEVRETLIALGSLLFAICNVAAYGHVVNDIFDVEEDQHRGKANAMARLAGVQRMLVALMFVALAIVPTLWVGFGLMGTLLLTINLLLPTIYSAPPIQLKKRGILGVVADALGVHVVPALLFASVMTHMAATPGPRSYALIAAVGIWALATGLRGILIHQFADRESDRAAGVQTFGGNVSLSQLRFFVFRIILPSEVVALATLIVLLLPVAPVLIIVVPVYLMFELLKVYAGWDLPLFQTEPSGGAEAYVPLANNKFYEAWVPLALAVQLALASPGLLSLVFLQIVLFLPNIDTRAQTLRDLWRDLHNPWSRRKGRSRFRAVFTYWAPTRKVGHRS